GISRLSCLGRISRDSPPRFYLTCLISFSDSRSRETTLFRQLRAGAARSGVARSAGTIPTGIIPRYLSFWELKTTKYLARVGLPETRLFAVLQNDKGATAFGKGPAESRCSKPSSGRKTACA